jgi:predicted nucleotidyltransferase
MVNTKIKVPRRKLISFCQKWKIAEFSIFGSALRSDFRPDSDIDVLVSFAPNAHPTFSDMANMEEELREIFGREVDLISKRGIEASRNFIRRKAILESAEVIYAAR